MDFDDDDDTTHDGDDCDSLELKRYLFELWYVTQSTSLGLFLSTSPPNRRRRPLACGGGGWLFLVLRTTTTAGSPPQQQHSFRCAHTTQHKHHAIRFGSHPGPGVPSQWCRRLWCFTAFHHRTLLLTVNNNDNVHHNNNDNDTTECGSVQGLHASTVQYHEGRSCRFVAEK